MYHVELRHFPHTAYRFNLDERELLALLDPWVHDKWIDLDERKWSPQQARLIVLEGPELPVYELSMGRGWRAAERKSKDVTDQVIEHARAVLLQDGVADGPPSDGAPAAAAGDADASPKGDADFRLLLGDDPNALLQAWQLVVQRRPELAPSESLALAEQTLRSLGSGGPGRSG